MSTCISREGEYSDHTPDTDYCCTRCYVLDEPALLDRVRELEAERDAALSTIAKVEEAVAGHPKCDQYEDDDAITCGWKNAYASVVRALGSVPPTGEGNDG